jgi:hypothetical protein
VNLPQRFLPDLSIFTLFGKGRLDLPPNEPCAEECSGTYDDQEYETEQLNIPLA